MKGRAVRLIIWSFILIGTVAGCADDPPKSTESLPSTSTSVPAPPATNTPAPPANQHTRATRHQYTNSSCNQHTYSTCHRRTRTTCRQHARALCQKHSHIDRKTPAQYPVHRSRRPLRREQVVPRGPHRKHPSGRRPDYYDQRQRVRLHHFPGRVGRDQRARRVRREQRRRLADQRTTLRCRRTGARHHLRPCPTINRRRREF